jgi:hypothetical protein
LPVDGPLLVRGAGIVDSLVYILGAEGANSWAGFGAGHIAVTVFARLPAASTWITLTHYLPVPPDRAWTSGHMAINRRRSVCKSI